jgi:hypothetical protein
VWVELKRQASVAGWTRSLAQPLVSSRDGRSLTVRFVPGGSGPALLRFAEHYPERDSVALESLGLSPREAEVLWRIARGASAPEIARELRISVGRVDALLKRVYIKLGVCQWPSRFPHWRPRGIPAYGHETSPRAATNCLARGGSRSAYFVGSGFTPFPEVASSSRSDSPEVTTT